MKSVMQTKEWSELRQSQGWRVHEVEDVFVLEKKLPFGFSFLYAPEVDFMSISTKLQKIYENTKKIAKENRAIFTRFDFINQKNSLFGEKMVKILNQNQFIKSFEEIQPEFRQIIDITGSEEKILTKMKPKGRYNIKIAQKHGLEIAHSLQLTADSKKPKKTDIDEFYKIFVETAKRDGFQIRPKSYFQKLYEILGAAGLAEIITVRYNGVAVASGIFTFYDGIVTYLYGASLSQYRNTMAPYLMHWEAIREAKHRDYKFYDLLAIAPFGKIRMTNDELRMTKKYSGITRFKEQLGGIKYQTVGSWDIVNRPGWYKIFRFIEKIRRS